MVIPHHQLPLLKALPSLRSRQLSRLKKAKSLLYLNGSGKKRLNSIIKTLTDIRDNFDSPANNDAFYGKVDCLLEELDSLMTNYKETK